MPLFSKRVWLHVQVLLAGAILSPGRRSVTDALRTIGLAQSKQSRRNHRALNRDVQLGRLVPNNEPLVIGVDKDKTLERRWGKEIAAKGIYQAPMRSSYGHCAKKTTAGHRP